MKVYEYRTNPVTENIMCSLKEGGITYIGIGATKLDAQNDLRARKTEATGFDLGDLFRPNGDQGRHGGMLCCPDCKDPLGFCALRYMRETPEEALTDAVVRLEACPHNAISAASAMDANLAFAQS